MKTKEPWTLTACRNLCRLMSDARDPVEHELAEDMHTVTVRRGGRSIVLTATEDGWTSAEADPGLRRPLNMTVPLARRIRELL